MTQFFALTDQDDLRWQSMVVYYCLFHVTRFHSFDLVVDMRRGAEWCGVLSCVAALLCAPAARADTPASSVRTAIVAVGQPYPTIPSGGEGWFDVGGYCKVVDADSASSLPNSALGVPVFIPGPAAQWENYRTSAKGVTQTTCCRPQSSIAQLCTEAGATPVSISRAYGKDGEVDTVTATCVDQWGKTYSDSINVTCQVGGGGVDGPDSQGEWVVGGDTPSGCTANAGYGACSASCGGGVQPVFDSCGNETGLQACNMQACCTTDYVKTGCSGSTATYTDEGTCHSGSYSVANGCTYVTETVGGTSCSFSVPDYAPGGASPSSSSYTEFWDCGGPGLSGDSWTSWGTTSGPGVSCSTSCSNSEPYISVTNGVETGHGTVCGVNSSTCTFSGYQ